MKYILLDNIYTQSVTMEMEDYKGDPDSSTWGIRRFPELRERGFDGNSPSIPLWNEDSYLLYSSLYSTQLPNFLNYNDYLFVWSE